MSDKVSPFTLNPKATFKETIEIPRAGDEPGKLTFTFKHRMIDEMQERLVAVEAELREARTEGATAKVFAIMAAHIAEIAEGWGFKGADDAFNEENITTLLKNYPRAFDAITTGYFKAMMLGREKN